MEFLDAIPILKETAHQMQDARTAEALNSAAHALYILAEDHTRNLDELQDALTDAHVISREYSRLAELHSVAKPPIRRNGLFYCGNCNARITYGVKRCNNCGQLLRLR